MASWKAFASAQEGLAEAGRRLIYQYGPGTGFLATVGSDGPRLHPINPIITDDGLFAFIVPGPKERDLRTDGRYALHAMLPDEVEEEFMVAGRATRRADPTARASAQAAYHARAPEDHVLYEFDIERALHATYRFRGDWPPVYHRWRET